jgi:hypothetical protein
MRDIIELAIAREAELLDAVLEFPEIPEHPLLRGRNSRIRLHRQTRKFSARGTSQPRFSTRTATPSQYVN